MHSIAKEIDSHFQTFGSDFKGQGVHLPSSISSNSKNECRCISQSSSDSIFFLKERVDVKNIGSHLSFERW